MQSEARMSGLPSCLCPSQLEGPSAVSSKALALLWAHNCEFHSISRSCVYIFFAADGMHMLMSNS